MSSVFELSTAPSFFRLSNQEKRYTKFRLKNRLVVDLFGNSSDTRGTRKGAGAGSIVYVNWRLSYSVK